MTEDEPTEVWGHSDDIVVAGDEEKYVYDTPKTITVDGVTIIVSYNGTWKFRLDGPYGITEENEDAYVRPRERVDPDEYNDYTEVVIIE